MVKGYCIGGSHHLAYHCDFTIAADTAILGQNGPRVGSDPHGRMVAQLAHIVGLKRAKEIWMLCRQYTAKEALAFGLVNAVVPLERLEEEVDQWCDELLDLCPTSLAMVKHSLEAVGGYLAQESGRVMAMVAPEFYRSEESKKAQRAFLEKTTARHWPRKEDAKWPAGV
jgi:1,4-dihydroxy-2-naphthoyl-CoA synthase